MIYEIVHTTVYDYDGRASFARCQLHLEPATRDGQRVLAHALEISPKPVESTRSRDFFGNLSVNLAFAEPHQTLTIRAVSTVEAAPGRPAPMLSEPWEAVRAAAAGSQDLGSSSPVHGLFGARHTPVSEEAAAYAAVSFAPGRPTVEAVSDLMRRIHADFAYDPRATEVSTPVAEVLASRRGVCQDFAHLMIAGLRSLGLPALYVSGYLRTVPPPGAEALVGADATHAWVSAWCGAGLGWIGFDPTNAILAGEDHVILAVGRDYADVAPSSGVVLSSAGHTLSVSVDVRPV
ncbi:transglutaminase [Alsobacter soli]|uniref:Transglutaminase n=1 Tax=Alsobacter soli TaxID=2109933 RepID=A0A2T1HQK8_9HYPH|nr:transglutaminase family protein [Alsobacter soli]PSC03917.1 transglutaminase [Alsobacter soli]